MENRNENLTDLMQSPIPPLKEKETLEKPKKITKKIKTKINQDNFDIGMISFLDWFASNCVNFENIKHVNISIKGIDQDDILIFTVPHEHGGKDKLGNLKRELFYFKNVKSYFVLNLPSSSMEVYSNNCFRIIYDCGNGIFLKCYGVKTGLIITHCVMVNNYLIPYYIDKIRKGSKGTNIVPVDPKEFINKLEEQAPLEALQIQYRQIMKHIDKINTIESAIKWFIKREYNVRDINHLMQIDSILLWMMNV